ncbi:hypothetical protein ACEQ8H_000397 [Pleosporales sp. CAS-2024a]
MARSSIRWARGMDPSSQGGRRKTRTAVPKGHAQLQDHRSPCPSPWNDGPEEAAAAADSATTVDTAESIQGANPIANLTSPFGAQEQDTNAQSTPANQGIQKPNDIALPTPIRATWPFRTLLPDGRVRYDPIPGFEHLYEPVSDVQEIQEAQVNQLNSVDTAHQPQSPRVSEAQPQTPPTQDDRQLARSQHARELQVPAKTNTGRASGSTNRKALKRTRSMAQGHGAPTSRAREATDDLDDNTRSNDDDDEQNHLTEVPISFCIGDFKALEIFFRLRFNELTMKPLRSMVTAWLKQLEPRRKGGYGPYHKKLPAEVPDGSPPWWPKNVVYVEPSHLDRESLLILALDILMQHRDIPIDALKRGQDWVAKLREVARFEISMTPEEQYSSSRNPVFRRLMKERAEKHILPSIFEVAQEYQNFLNRPTHWEALEDTKYPPMGRIVTYSAIARPEKVFSRSKRLRPDPEAEMSGSQMIVSDVQEPGISTREVAAESEVLEAQVTKPRTSEPKAKQKEVIKEALAVVSGDDVEIDETLCQLAAQIMRRREAHNKAKATVVVAEPVTNRTPDMMASIADARAREQTVEVASHAVTRQRPVETTPLTTPLRNQCNQSVAESLITPSFDQSMEHLRLRDSISIGGFSHEQNSVAPSPVTPYQYNSPLSASDFGSEFQSPGASNSYTMTPSQATAGIAHYDGSMSAYHDNFSTTSKDCQAQHELHGFKEAEGVNYIASSNGLYNCHPHSASDNLFAYAPAPPSAQLNFDNHGNSNHFQMLSSMALQPNHTYGNDMALNDSSMYYWPQILDPLYEMKAITSEAPSPSTTSVDCRQVMAQYSATPFSGLPYEYPVSQY